MGVWKTNAKQDGCKGQGPAQRQKTPAKMADMNPRRERLRDYDPGNAESRRDRSGRA